MLPSRPVDGGYPRCRRENRDGAASHRTEQENRSGTRTVRDDAGAAGDRTGSRRTVLGRALAVLGTFATDRPELVLGAIVAATGLPPSTAYRLVAELVAWGALEKVGRGRYRVGIRLPSCVPRTLPG